ncbi:hypothetical protein EDC65_4583 [Stella humosa]|uniref:Uncharacterized protein n=2 Tax=Stella humosa TaxID=94 RepID=A0A3N1L0L3_9PROT|nr:hypothetical protein EDC65_4583 [Stella humosa]BBK30172.1 hypothetical protein STHU_08060 [Stella humosa]
MEPVESLEASLERRFPPPEAYSHLAGDDWPADGPIPADTDAQRRFGQELLGPIFLQFCQRLHMAGVAFADRRARLLFAARGGLRLRLLYELWCERSGTQPVLPLGDILISRVAAAKGCLAADFDHVAPMLVREFGAGSLGYMLRCLLRGRAVDLPDVLAHCPVTVGSFAAIYRGEDALGQAVRDYFAEQAQAMAAYLEGLLAGIDTPVLVDSGWTGGTQALLMRDFPQWDWHGLYFGKWDYGRGPGPHFGHIFGVAVDSLEPYANAPGQALFAYHHLIEDPLEIDAASVESYRLLPDGRGMPEGGDIDPMVLPPGRDDAMFQGIVDHFHSPAGAGDFMAVERRAHEAYRRLRRMILWPRPAELPGMQVRPRSADFGRSLTVPVLLRLPDASLKRRVKSVAAALWKPGQMVVAFPRLHGLVNGSSYLLRRIPFAGRFVDPLLRRGSGLARRVLRRLLR